jgi:hypothetical protein
VLSSSADGDRQVDAGPNDNTANDNIPNDRAASCDSAGLEANETLGRDLLDSVLRQTAPSSSADDAPTAADMVALRDVADRHRGKKLVVQPIVVELVQAVLSEQFQPVVASGESWDTMCSGIAQTLFDDPVSRDRLDSLWSRLSEGNL